MSQNISMDLAALPFFSQAQAHVLSLPTEIVLNIFKFLDRHEDFDLHYRRPLSSVCRTFKSVISNNNDVEFIVFSLLDNLKLNAEEAESSSRLVFFREIALKQTQLNFLGMVDKTLSTIETNEICGILRELEINKTSPYLSFVEDTAFLKEMAGHDSTQAIERATKIKDDSLRALAFVRIIEAIAPDQSGTVTSLAYAQITQKQPIQYMIALCTIVLKTSETNLVHMLLEEIKNNISSELWYEYLLNSDQWEYVFPLFTLLCRVQLEVRREDLDSIKFLYNMACSKRRTINCANAVKLDTMQQIKLNLEFVKLQKFFFPDDAFKNGVSLINSYKITDGSIDILDAIVTELLSINSERLEKTIDEKFKDSKLHFYLLCIIARKATGNHTVLEKAEAEFKRWYPENSADCSEKVRMSAELIKTQAICGQLPKIDEIKAIADRAKKIGNRFDRHNIFLDLITSLAQIINLQRTVSKVNLLSNSLKRQRIT